MFEDLKSKFEEVSERNTESWGDSEEMMVIKDKMLEVDFGKTVDYFDKLDDLGW